MAFAFVLMPFDRKAETTPAHVLVLINRDRIIYSHMVPFSKLQMDTKKLEARIPAEPKQWVGEVERRKVTEEVRYVAYDDDTLSNNLRQKYLRRPLI